MKTSFTSTQSVLPQSILSKLDIREDGCWLWQGYRQPNGYGKITYLNQKHYIHRLVYQLLVGKLHVGKVIDHKCEIVNCVNPAHLQQITQRANTLKGASPAAINSRKETCKNGHSISSIIPKLISGRYRRRCKCR